MIVLDTGRSIQLQAHSMSHRTSTISPMTTVIRYRWRYFDEIRARYVVTNYHASEDQVCGMHPDAVPLRETRQELTLPDDPVAATSAAHLYR